MNNTFTLWLSDQFEKPYNCSYPYETRVQTQKDLIQAAMYDHVMAKYMDGMDRTGAVVPNCRGNDRFIESDCLAMDLDNNHTDSPGEWKTTTDVMKYFPNVAFYSVTSRNHMKPKAGKTPRPKYHIYFPIDRITSAEDYRKLKEDVIKVFPWFDESAKDAARFFFGNIRPQAAFHGGKTSVNLTKYMEPFTAIQTDMEPSPARDDDAAILVGQRNTTMHNYALRVLKRYGDTENARGMYQSRSTKCIPPLDKSELDNIWRSAAGFYESHMKSDPNYKPPGEFEREYTAERNRKQPVTTKTIRDALNEMGIIVRGNVISGEAEVIGLPDKYDVMSAMAVAPVLIHDYLKNQGYSCSRATVDDCLMLIANENRYNPVVEMLMACKHDAADRFAELRDILGIKDDSLDWLFLKKWLHQSVAMAHNEDTEPYGADGVLVLQGSQGVGKTYFFRRLAVRPDWFLEGAVIDLDRKDSVMQATAVWITELGELDSTLKREQSSLKAFLTSAADTYRPPYGRVALKKPRRTSFCATVNPEGFLNDETGSRRYWTIHVDDIDVERLKQLDTWWFCQLWTQVYEELYLPEPDGYRLTQDERAYIDTRNQVFAKKVAWEVEILESLDWSLDERFWRWYKANDMKKLLGNYSASAESVGRALSAIAKGDSRIRIRMYNGIKQYRLPEYGLSNHTESEVESSIQKALDTLFEETKTKG